MFGRRRPEANHPEAEAPAAAATVDLAEPKRGLLDVVQPMQQVRIRWHTLDGGESAIPGHVELIDGEMVELRFDRNAPSFDRFRTLKDDVVWIDTFSGADTYVFSAWLLGVRQPNTLVIMIRGLPRRDQRRQHVREIVDLPAQSVQTVDEDDEPIGQMHLAKIHDLSGGGVKMELHETVKKDDRLLLNLELGETSFDAIVVVIDAFRTVRGRQFVRCAFVGIEERFRRAVIRFVFSEQLRKSRSLTV